MWGGFACKSYVSSSLNVAAKYASFVSVVKCRKDVEYWGGTLVRGSQIYVARKHFLRVSEIFTNV